MTPVSPILQVACDGFVVREFVQPPGLKIPEHAHKEATLVIVISGGAVDRFGRHEIPLGPGQLLVRPVGEEHAHQYGPEGAHIVAFSFADASSQRALQRTQRGSLRIGTHLLLQELHTAEPERPLALECRAAGLFEDLGGARGGERRIPGWLQRVCDAIHDRCAWKPSLQELAELAGVHQGHLTRAFRTHLHASIGEYVRERRVERAERLLAEGRRSFAEIALECGFFDQSHLIRAFHRARGMTPLCWLQMRGLSNRKSRQS